MCGLHDATPTCERLATRSQNPQCFSPTSLSSSCCLCAGSGTSRPRCTGKKILNDGLMDNRATARLWVYKRTLCWTAVKFWAHAKEKKRITRTYHFKSTSRDKSKTWVTGGPDLASSATYTQKFCLAAIIVWKTIRWTSLREGVPARASHKRIWAAMFGKPEDPVETKQNWRNIFSTTASRKPP